jgi:hypothetical protein
MGSPAISRFKKLSPLSSNRPRFAGADLRAGRERRDHEGNVRNAREPLAEIG